MEPRLRRPGGGLVTLAVLTCTIGLSGCGGGFDSALSGEHLIRDYVKKFGQAKVNLRSVKCPGGVADKVGGSYDCKVVLHDTSTGADHLGTITIHMRSGNKVEITGSQDIHVQ